MLKIALKMQFVVLIKDYLNLLMSAHKSYRLNVIRLKLSKSLKKTLSLSLKERLLTQKEKKISLLDFNKKLMREKNSVKSRRKRQDSLWRERKETKRGVMKSMHKKLLPSEMRLKPLLRKESKRKKMKHEG